MMGQISTQSHDPNVRQLLKNLAGAISKALHSASTLSTEVPGLSLYRTTAPTAPNPCTYEPSLLLIPKERNALAWVNRVMSSANQPSFSHQSNFRSSAEYALPAWRNPTLRSSSSLIWAWSATFSTPRKCGFLH